MSLAWVVLLALAPARAQEPDRPSPESLGPATADLPSSEPLDRATADLYAAAVRAEAAGDWRRAEAGYRLVLGRDSGYEPAILGLARARVARGDRAGAEAVLERLPADAGAVEALARLVEQHDPVRAAKLYRRLQTLRLGDAQPWLDEARVLADIDPQQAVRALDIYLGLLDGEPDGEVLVAVAAALEEAGDEDGAVSLLQRYLKMAPTGAAASEVRGRLDRIAVEQQARQLAVGGGRPLPARLRPELEKARRELSAGNRDDALEVARLLVREAPRSAEAWAALGDVHEALDRVVEAERAYEWAIALAPDEAAWHARLGGLLADRYGGRRNREAAEQLTKALTLRPSWAELHYKLGRVHQAMGRWKEAISDYKTYLAAEPHGAWAEEARRRAEDLARPTPEPLQPTVAGSKPAEVPARAWERYKVARVYLERDDTANARKEIDAVLAIAPHWAAAMNLSAAVALRSGDEDAAIAAWTRSLQVDPDQPRVKLELGELFSRRGQVAQARRLLKAAAAGGAPEAHYRLANLAWQEDHPLALGALFEADRELDAYFASAGGGMTDELALALRAKVDQRMHLLLGGMAAALGVTVLSVGSWWWRRRSARPVEALAEAAPEAVHELAPILSAIRHEVLKHNTALLGEVARALDLGDHHVVAFAATRLFDENGGVTVRFEEYLNAIARLGRQHGVRVDPRRRDRVLTPMWRAMRRLARLEPVLRRPWKAGPGVVREVERIDTALNDTGYRALGELVRRMGTVEVTPELIEAVGERVRGEPGLVERELSPLEVEAPEGPLRARVFPGDLADIIANVLRNAWRAVESGGRVGVVLTSSADPITGLEHVELRFRDTAPGRLTDEVIRSREPGRGLGIVVDLITRHDGTITVEPEPGWAKAVVVRLPRAEDANASPVQVVAGGVDEEVM